MKVLLVAATKKYTGAGAVAEAMTRALLAAEVDARFLFYGGRNLERRLAAESWALPLLRKERHPGQLLGNLRTLRRAAADCDALVCHLPHDHLLCLLAGLDRRLPLIRSYRNPRHLRRGLLQDALHRRSTAALLAHSEMTPAPLPPLHLALPVPIEERFTPGLDGSAWRRRLGIPDQDPVLGMVGKLAAGRGFELLLETAARTDPLPRVLAVGVGEARARLERRAARLGLDSRVHWAGYQEEGLPELYAAMDVVLFAAAGSDHGHRSISEAQACARVVLAADLPGVSELIRHEHDGLIAPPHPDALATATSRLVANRAAAASMAEAAGQRAAERRGEVIGRRLAQLIDQARASHFG